jgi:beta-glucosidase/6-phospho-beta-glucosidase/beta-galactosidase
MHRGPSHKQFMFATGIENSYPVITGEDGKSLRVDEMEKCGFYSRWREDFSLVREIGLEYLRYGPPYYRVHLGPDRHDWSFTDETFAELQRLEITPITDLCHFGVPDWIGDFQNPDWPELFGQFAGAFASRFPWVRFYTPINEILVNAIFSAEFGWWNERLKSAAAFVNSLKHMCRASLLAEEEILRNQPQALFVQSETTTYYHARNPQAEERVEFENNKRFLSFDLCYGYPVRSPMYEYLMDNGLSRDEYHWFMQHGKAMRPHCVMGNDYYVTNEHRVSPEDGPMVPSGEIFGYYVITKQYFDRYQLPVMHTETNLANPEQAPEWLWKEWSNMIRLRKDGVPIIGFTWYSLTDQMDWDSALRNNSGHVNPLGLYDLNRNIRPVGKAYKELVSEWRDILPLETFSLSANVP